MSDGQRISTALLVRAILSLGAFFVLMGAVLFLSAGDIRWWKGWAFLLAFSAWSFAGTIYLWRVNPDIFLARSKLQKGTKAWDKALLSPLLASFVALFVIGAIDSGRMHWSSVPLWLTFLGYLLFSAGMAGSLWVYSVNKFAEPGVRIQTERGHKVVTTGPYAIVRHPLYLASGIMCAGIPLALGSLWAYVPVAIGAVVILVRTALEDRTLLKELEGYKEYAARVRYRLIPGIW